MQEKAARIKPGDAGGSPEQSVGKDTNHTDNCPPLPEEAWKNMYLALYDYHFGHIDFLGLLDQWEEILEIKPPATNIQTYRGFVDEQP